MSNFNDVTEEQLIDLLKRYCPNDELNGFDRLYFGLDGVEFGIPISHDKQGLNDFMEAVYDQDCDTEDQLKKHETIRVINFSSEGIFEMGKQLITNKNLLGEYKNRFDDGSKQKLENVFEKSRKELKNKCLEYNLECKECLFKRFNNNFKISEIEQINEIYEENFKQLKDYVKQYIDCVVNLRFINGSVSFDVEDKIGGGIDYSNVNDLGCDLSNYFVVKAETSYEYISSGGELDQFLLSFAGKSNEELGEQDKEQFAKLLSRYIFCSPNVDHIFVDLENKKFLRTDDFEHFIEELFKEVGKPMFIPYYD